MDTEIILKENEIVEYIEDTLECSKEKFEKLKNSKYHHNASYSSSPSIIKHGIIPIEKLNEFGIKSFSSEQLKSLNNITSHVNGVDGISLSVVGLEDLYPNEEEYNPYLTDSVDINISSDIKAIRFTEHYGNEYVTFNSILPKDIRSIDLRILKYMKDYMKNGNIKSQADFYDRIIRMYNNIVLISKEIKNNNRDIFVREMSFKPINININNISDSKKIIKSIRG